MLTVMFTVVNGNMTRLMAMGLILTTMAPRIRVNGTKISSQAWVEKYGLMVLPIQVATSRAKSMDMGHLNGQMVLCI